MLRTPQYTKDQRVFMVNRRSSGDTYKMINFDFKRKFPLSGRDPSNNTIYRNKKRFESEGDLQVFVFISYTIYFLSLGTILNLNKGRSGRKPSALTPQKLQMMEDMLDGNLLIIKN